MSDLKPWDPDYVAPKPDTMAQKRASAKNVLKSAEAKKRKKEKGLAEREPDPDSSRSKKLANMTVDTISLKKRVFLDLFLAEYLHDFSVSKAWVRAGGKPSGATSTAYDMIKTGYCQSRMREIVDMMEEEALVTDKEIVLGIKKEANYFGEDSSQTGRVAAWKLLAQLKGKLIKRTETNVNNTGGVMLIPVPASVQEWETMTATQQEQLKADVRT